MAIVIAALMVLPGFARLRVARRVPSARDSAAAVVTPAQIFEREAATIAEESCQAPKATKAPRAAKAHKAAQQPQAAPTISLDTIDEDLGIFGEPMVSLESLTAFVLSHNADFDPAIAEAFIEVGRRYGIRGDIALCQAVVETGWFKYTGGTAVTPDQHNYCGLGVTTRGTKGHTFDTIEDGVTAQIQHLYAYATKNPLPAGEQLIDPRFKLVRRGTASTWRGLSNTWAMNSRYSASIINLYKQLITFHNNRCVPTQNSKE